jgi:organic hydroperoxide reductase OsmC/OhrA
MACRQGVETMSLYRARVSWVNAGPDFLANQYSRVHQWQFEGGQTIDATAAPAIVPAPWSEAANVDPEQAFVASLSSCHMLFFLHFAARQGYRIESYEDEAEGLMEKNAGGRMAITRVVLRPRVTFTGHKKLDTGAAEALHEAAHKHCFIANSVTTVISIESRGYIET